MRVIISGGGTGGHIFPAISIADCIRRSDPGAQILFVGAEGRMEMEKVPAAGYEIKGLPVAGLQRKISLANLALPYKLGHSLRMAAQIIRKFKPDVAVGVGGYASAPLLWSACRLGIPCLIQEQNSFAGLTNRLLSRRVRRICVAYDGMERFFPADKIVFTGNPIRSGFAPRTESSKAEGIEFYGLDPSKMTIFIVGGSLGSKTLNDSVRLWIEKGCPGSEGVQLLWQCGKYYKASTDAFMAGRDLPGIIYRDFIPRMDLAYCAADLVVSRSGASSISELCVCRRPTVFVPSPNVAEDHQTFNAMSLVNKGAAVMVRDIEARERLLDEALGLVHDDKRLKELSDNMIPLGISDADRRITDEIFKLVNNR